MWVDAASYFILDTQLVHPNEAMSQAAQLFERATRDPRNGPPHTPKRLRVSDEALATALRGSIDDVELVLAPTPEIDQIVEDMRAHLARGSKDLSFIGSEMSSQDVGAMFSAAARLYRAAPWKVLPPDACIGVSCNVLGIRDGAMCVVGQMGQSHGFSLFASIESTLAFFDVVDASERGERGLKVPAHIMFAYDSRDEVPVELVREVASHHWELAGHDAYPSPRVLDDELVARGVTRVEMLGLTAT
jgi:hypothetical protein